VAEEPHHREERELGGHRGDVQEVRQGEFGGSEYWRTYGRRGNECEQQRKGKGLNSVFSSAFVLHMFNSYGAGQYSSSGWFFVLSI